MTVFEAIIQGIIQGATEFLPVSSSGHLSITQHVFGIELPGILFDIMLHLGTLIAVVFVYRMTILKLFKELISLVKDIFHRSFRWSEMSKDRRLLMMLIISLVPLFLLFIPIPGTGMQIKDYSEFFATDTSILLEGIFLLITSGLLFLAIRTGNKLLTGKIVTNSDGQLVQSNGRKKIHTIDAILIGIMQFFAAVFPGLSRSGSTLSVGMLRGINKQAALDFSFIMGIPAILAATVMALGDAGSEDIAQIGVLPLIVGLIVAAVVGFLAIKLLKWMLASSKLEIFAYYTLILGGIVTILGIIEHIIGSNLFTGKPL